MTHPFHVSEYACGGGGSDLPRTLWRVTHSGTRSREDPTSGDLVARNSTLEFDDASEFTREVEAHIDWHSRDSSRFLSTFSDWNHAFHWALSLLSRRPGLGYIHEIDTAQLPPDTLVFKMESVQAKLGLSYKYAKNEYLFLHRIPARAIVDPRANNADVDPRPEEPAPVDALATAMGRLGLVNG